MHCIQMIVTENDDRSAMLVVSSLDAESQWSHRTQADMNLNGLVNKRTAQRGGKNYQATQMVKHGDLTLPGLATDCAGQTIAVLRSSISTGHMTFNMFMLH